MKINTGRWLEDRFGHRVSVHLFRWGIHFKLRRKHHWRHLVFKFTRGSALGSVHGRRMLWIGWWESRKGIRGNLNGFRFLIAVDRLPQRPRETIPIPFFPQGDALRSAQRRKLHNAQNTD